MFYPFEQGECGKVFKFGCEQRIGEKRKLETNSNQRFWRAEQRRGKASHLQLPGLAAKGRGSPERGHGRVMDPESAASTDHNKVRK